MDPYIAKLIGRETRESRDASLKKCEKGERTFYLINGILSDEQYGVLLVGMRNINNANGVRCLQRQLRRDGQVAKQQRSGGSSI
jgi:hypothetical protein